MATKTQAKTQPADSVLSRTCMLVSLVVSVWSARRLDRTATAAADQAMSAQNGKAGRYNKMLIDPKALAPVVTAAGKLRTILYTRTLPWLDEGPRVLSNVAFLDFGREMSDAREAFNRAVRAFIDDYPRLMQEARNVLGRMYDQSQYPWNPERKFGVKVTYLPFPCATDFRLEAMDDELDTLKHDMAAQTAAWTDTARKDVHDRIRDVAARIIDRMGAYNEREVSGGKGRGGVFRDSLITGARDLVAILPSLNVTGDSLINDLTRKLDELASTDPDSLRENGARREKVKVQAQDIVDSMAGVL